MSEGEVPLTPVAHYASREYLTKERLCSYWHQVDDVLTFGAGSVLEIGPGPGISARLLSEAGLSVTTCDYDATLAPDVVADATDLPFDAGSFDVVVCCQVLEHLEFEAAETALTEIARVCRLGAVVSVPDLAPWIGVAYPLYFGWTVDRLRERFPRRDRLRALIRRELKLREAVFLTLVPARWGLGGPTWELSAKLIPNRMVRLPEDDDHKWELGANGITAATLLAAITAAGLEVEREYRVPENPWHHFFVLRCRS